MKLERRLEEWKAAGLVTAEQAERINVFEKNRPGATGRWLVWGFVALGGLAVVAGVISLVAANWDELPDGLKLAGGLALLLGTLGGAVRLEGRGENWPRDLLLLLHQGLVLAMIGLVAQVFHLSGHPWRAPALAAFLAWPLALAVKRSLLTDVALGYSILSLFLFLEEQKVFDSSGLTVGLLSGALGLVLVASVRFLGRRVPASAAAGRRWAAGLILVALLVGVFAMSVHDSFFRERVPAAWPAWTLVAALALAVAAGGRQAIRPSWLATAALGLALILGGAYFVDHDETWLRVVGFLLACGFCVAFTWASAEEGSRLGVNAGTLALALRLLALFLEVLGSLTQTGLGLIASGVVLLGLGYGWWKLRVMVRVAAPPAVPAAGTSP
jgi:uncharacterized membrane protein